MFPCLNFDSLRRPKSMSVTACTLKLYAPFPIRRLHAPAYIYYLHAANDIFLVFNSSINFVIYCCVNEEFRDGWIGQSNLILFLAIL